MGARRTCGTEQVRNQRRVTGCREWLKFTTPQFGCGADQRCLLPRRLRALVVQFLLNADLVGKVKSRVQDSALSQAEFLRVLACVPVRLFGEKDISAEEQDRVVQNEQIEGIVDESVRRRQ